MYKEKLIEYINRFPDLDFILKIKEDFIKVEFKKEDDKYYFITTDVEKAEDDYKVIGESYKESLSLLDENICKEFVDEWNKKIVQEYVK